MNGFDRDFTIELNLSQGLMEDWRKCQISPLVKYRPTNIYKYSMFSFSIYSVVWSCVFINDH